MNEDVSRKRSVIIGWILMYMCMYMYVYIFAWLHECIIIITVHIYVCTYVCTCSALQKCLLWSNTVYEEWHITNNRWIRCQLSSKFWCYMQVHVYSDFICTCNAHAHLLPHAAVARDTGVYIRVCTTGLHSLVGMTNTYIRTYTFSKNASQIRLLCAKALGLFVRSATNHSIWLNATPSFCAFWHYHPYILFLF